MGHENSSTAFASADTSLQFVEHVCDSSDEHALATQQVVPAIPQRVPLRGFCVSVQLSEQVPGHIGGGLTDADTDMVGVAELEELVLTVGDDVLDGVIEAVDDVVGVGVGEEVIVAVLEGDMEVDADADGLT